VVTFLADIKKELFEFEQNVCHREKITQLLADNYAFKLKIGLEKRVDGNM